MPRRLLPPLLALIAIAGGCADATRTPTGPGVTASLPGAPATPDTATARAPEFPPACRDLSPCGGDTIVIAGDDRAAVVVFALRNLGPADERFALECATEAPLAGCAAPAFLHVASSGEALVQVSVRAEAGGAGLGAVHLRAEPTVNVRDGGRGHYWVRVE
jgi:hypothetical protein